ncbi:MAG: hypothetical protein J6K66_05535 [Clostridia bacterium]|nr:hypothetical protein [Clostridia bacterium]
MIKSAAEKIGAKQSPLTDNRWRQRRAGFEQCMRHVETQPQPFRAEFGLTAA